MRQPKLNRYDHLSVPSAAIFEAKHSGTLLLNSVEILFVK